MAEPTQRKEEVVQEQRTEGMLAAALGTGMEWFDWGIYGIFLPFFAISFFDPEHALAASLGAWVVFAVGFLARPVGGILFGRIGDLRGRKRSMVLVSAAAGIGSTIIALGPTFEQIGIFAALLLVTARIIQGLAHGGEMPAAGAFISEVSKPHNRGAWSSIIYVFGNIGQGVGFLLAALLTTLLSNSAMVSWGWRIAFGIGALGSFAAMFYRMSVKETAVFAVEQAKKPKPQIWKEIWKARKKALQIIGMSIGLTVTFYLATTVLGAYHINILGQQLYGWDPQTGAAGAAGITKTDYAAQVNWVTLGVLIPYIASLPLLGWLSDKIGRKPIMWYTTVGIALVTVPLLTWLNGEIYRLGIAVGVMLLLLGGASAIFPALMAEIVPTQIRTTGVALPYALATGIFGGTAPYLQQWMSTNWGANTFGWYVAAMIVISAITVLTIPETKGIDMRDVK